MHNLLYVQTPSFYSLMSKTPFSGVPLKDCDLKSVTLPCNPGFIYAAYQCDDGSKDATVTCFPSIPNFLEGFVHILDVSCEKMSTSKNLNYQKVDSSCSVGNITSKNIKEDEHILTQEEESDRDKNEDDTQSKTQRKIQKKERKPKPAKSQLRRNTDMSIPGLWGKEDHIPTTLTSVEITKLHRKKIAAQKYPCFLQKSKFQVKYFPLMCFIAIHNY